MRKKGDIPITILVIGVLGVCILTLFSFWNDVDKKNENFIGPGLIETIYSVQEEINFGYGENLNPFEKNGVKIIEENGIINAIYSSDGEVLVSIEYTPIK